MLPRSGGDTSWGIKEKLSYFIYLRILRWESERLLPVRRLLLDVILHRQHKRLNIFPDVFIEGVRNLTLGEDVSINRSSNLSCYGGLTIGDNVSIGHGASILTTEHTFSGQDVPIKAQPIIRKPVHIGSNVWIGAKVCILAGVSIADGCVIAAGAVVTKSVSAQNTIIGGVPARHIKHRFFEESDAILVEEALAELKLN